MNYYPPNGYNNYQMNNAYGYGSQAPNPVYMKAQERKRLSYTGKICGLSVIMFVVLGTIIGLIMSRFPKIVNEYTYNSAFSNSLNIVITILTLGGPFLAGYILLKRKGFAGGIPLGAPYNKTEFGLLIPIGVAVCILGSFATGMFSTFVDAIFGIEFTQPDDGSSYNTVSGIAFSLLQTALVPAFIEEFVIRGVVMQSLRRYGDAFAIVTSAAVFALMHGNMIQIPFAFIAGMALGYIVIRTGTMWTGIIIHFLNNALAVTSLSLLDNMSEAATTTVLSVIYIIIFASAAICAGFLFVKNRNLTGCLSAGRITYFRNSEKAAAFVLNVPMIIAIAVFAYETSLYISK